MLKKPQRLETKQFNETISKGKVFHSSLFLMRVLGGQTDTRISAVAPTKIFKKAVGRNKARRMIYGAIKSAGCSVGMGVHAIIFAKSGVLEAKPEEVAADIKNLFVKAGLIR